MVAEDILLDKIKDIFDKHKQPARIELLIDLAIFVAEREQEVIKGLAKELHEYKKKQAK